jgi:hypothetical protein
VRERGNVPNIYKYIIHDPDAHSTESQNKQNSFFFFCTNTQKCPQREKSQTREEEIKRKRGEREKAQSQSIEKRRWRCEREQEKTESEKTDCEKRKKDFAKQKEFHRVPPLSKDVLNDLSSIHRSSNVHKSSIHMRISKPESPPSAIKHPPRSKKC